MTAAHTDATGVDAVLASVDFDRAELDGIVAAHRGLTDRHETVMAYELPVEDLATAVYELAHRLAAVTGTAAHHTGTFSPAGDLARRVAAAAAPRPGTGAIEAAARALGVQAGGTPETGMLSESFVYGRPGHRLVRWYRMDLSALADGNGGRQLVERRAALVCLDTMEAAELQDGPRG